MKVYLGGPIYTANTPKARKATDRWRAWISWYFRLKYLEVDFKIELINPCRKKAIYDSKLFTPNEIIFRDLKDIENADLLLVNLNLLGDKLPIGSVMEIMYAWTLQKPVVIVSTDPRITSHPWLIAMSVRIFSDLKTACDYIVEFWA